ncbi:hypothetical protein J4E83_009592 [Alternaria metachromatica]|uniref:uncharacterized protein n=1 Tax=Alternaria metachromatica TaxID=283354 RepID=UPI0020C4BF68|nr:uncharacterized protein J4E83_009592 [Alternaria metachromatica]KAI4607409.1 hypothetical protein J4E83_009592 [Alternaria metachromatica]
MPNTPSNARRVFELRLAQSALSPHDRTAAPTPLADLRTLDDLVWTKEAVCVAALVLGFQDYYCEDLEAFEKRVQTSLGETGGCKSFQDVWHNIKGVTEHWGADWWTVLRRHQIQIQQVPSFNLAVYLNKYSKAAQPLSDVVAEIQAFDKVRRQDLISVQRRYDPTNPTYFGQTAQRLDCKSWRFFHDLIAWRDKRSNDTLAADVSSERARRLEKRQNRPSNSPDKKKNRKRRAVIPRTPANPRDHSRSQSVERPRRGPSELPDDDTSLFEDHRDSLSFQDSTLQEEDPQDTLNNQESPFRRNSITDLDTSRVTEDDPSFGGDDIIQPSTPVHSIDLMSLKMLAQDPDFRAVMHIIVKKKKEIQSAKEDNSQATFHLAQAQETARSHALEAQKALQLSTLPSEDSLEQIKTEFSAKLKATRDYNDHLAGDITAITNFASLGVASATQDVTKLEAMKDACEAEIRQIEHRVTQYGAWAEKMGAATTEVEEAKERSRKANQVLLTADDMMRIAELWLGKPSAKLSIEVLEDLLKEPLEGE